MLKRILICLLTPETLSSILCRLWNHRRGRAQDGPSLDHGGTGEHCHTHIIPRLQKVIAGGQGQWSTWQGGGGFRYYTLAPSLIVNDRWGNSVINPEYNAAQLAEALAKLEGFSYAP